MFELRNLTMVDPHQLCRPHALAHENCEHCRCAAGLIGTKVVWQHTPNNSMFTSSDMFSMISYHADTRLTWSFMKADIYIQWQRSERQNSPSSGSQSRALLQVATLGIHTSLLSWIAAAGTSENAHKHVPAFDLSLVNQCAKIKLGSWVQPTALVHFELKLSLYVCQPKLHMQCIEILSRAIPRLLAVSNAMPPNRNMLAYLQKWKMFFDLLNRNNSISLGFRRNWLLPRSKQCLSFRNAHRKHISIRKPALPKSLQKSPAGLQA